MAKRLPLPLVSAPHVHALRHLDATAPAAKLRQRPPMGFRAPEGCAVAAMAALVCRRNPVERVRHRLRRSGGAALPLRDQPWRAEPARRRAPALADLRGRRGQRWGEDPGATDQGAGCGRVAGGAGWGAGRLAPGRTAEVLCAQRRAEDPPPDGFSPRRPMPQGQAERLALAPVATRGHPQPAAGDLGWTVGGDSCPPPDPGATAGPDATAWPPIMAA
jgi:hypothetical protein